LHIALYAPTFVRPSETFIYDAATELAKLGNRVTIVTANRMLADEYPFPSVEVATAPARWNLIRILRRATSILFGARRQDEQHLMHRERLRKVLDRVRPNVILANYGPSGVLLAPVAEAMGIPLVVSFHGADASRLALDPARREDYEEMLQTVAAVTGPSSYVCNRLQALGCPSDRLHVSRNGVKTERLLPAPRGMRSTDEEVRFLFVGRLAQKKDPMTLIRSFDIASKRLAPRHSSLTVVGDGPLRDEVKALVADLDLQSQVHLAGRQTHDQVFAHLQSAHIYVQHSVTAPSGDEEGLPVSITEAMAAGLPVVSTRHSGIPEAVHDEKSGLLVDEKDVEGMARCMVRLALDPELCKAFGTMGRRIIDQEFAMPIARDRLQRLLLDTAGASSQTSLAHPQR